MKNASDESESLDMTFITSLKLCLRSSYSKLVKQDILGLD